MADLRSVQGSSLIPDRTQSLNLFLESFGTPETRRQKRVFEEQVDILSRDPDAKRRESALVRISAINPQVGLAVNNLLQTGDANAIAAASREAAEGLRQATLIKKQKTFGGKKNALLSLAREKVSNNQDPSRILELLELSEDQLGLELQRMETIGPDVLTVLKPGEAIVTPTGEVTAERAPTVKAAPSPFAKIKTEDFTPKSLRKFEKTGVQSDLIPVEADAASAIGKLNADFDKGLITAKERDAGIKKVTNITGPLVSLQTFESEKARLGARSDAAVRDEVRGNARNASRQLGKIRSLSKLLKDTPQGALRQFFPQIGRLIPGFDATNEQAAQAQINSFILDEMSKFKGNTSDRELQFASQTVAQLGDTPEANRIILRSFENVIFLAGQENRQFDEFVKGGGKARDFVFDFQKVIFPNHPTLGNITLDDIQLTAFVNKITMEETLKEMRNR